MTNNNSQLELYLQSESQRYEDWFLNFVIETHPDAEPVSKFPSLDRMKMQFQQWYMLNKTLIQYQVCVVWGYREKRKRFDNAKALITAGLVDVLSLALGTPATGLLGVAVILVAEGFLDRLCRIDNKNN